MTSVHTSISKFGKSLVNDNIEKIIELMNDPSTDLSHDNYKIVRYACIDNYKNIIEMLLSPAFSHRNDPSIWGPFGIELACQFIENDNDIVKLLLDDSRIDPSKCNCTIDTALASKNIELAELMIKDGRFDIDKNTNQIELSVSNGYTNIVELLLQNPNIDPLMKLSTYWHVWQAYKNGHNKIVDLMLGDKRVNPMALTRNDFYKKYIETYQQNWELQNSQESGILIPNDRNHL